MARSYTDQYMKGILEDLFSDFLRFFYPNADELFDINRGFEFLDQEVEKLFPVGNTEYQKSVDKLVKVYTKDGKEEWMLVHIEVQGYYDAHFAERMFIYFYRIRDSYGKRVRSIAIFTDDRHSYHSNEYVYQEDETSVIFRFKTYKVLDQDPEELEASNNPFAWVILTIQLALQRERLQTDDYFQLTMDLVRRLYRKGFDRDKIYQLLVFIKKYVHFDKPEINSKFDNELDKLDYKTRTMGIFEQIAQIEKEEAREEATEKSKAAFVKKLLQKTVHSVEDIADLAEVSVDFVQKIREQLNLK